jgi:hypothetical protein
MSCELHAPARQPKLPVTQDTGEGINSLRVSHTYGGARQGSSVLSSDTLCSVSMIEIKVQDHKEKWRSGSTAPLIPNLAAE